MLTQEQITHFEVCGFVAAKGLLTDDEVTQLVADYKAARAELRSGLRSTESPVRMSQRWISGLGPVVVKTSSVPMTAACPRKDPTSRDAQRTRKSSRSSAISPPAPLKIRSP